MNWSKILNSERDQNSPRLKICTSCSAPTALHPPLIKILLSNTGTAAWNLSFTWKNVLFILYTFRWFHVQLNKMLAMQGIQNFKILIGKKCLILLFRPKYLKETKNQMVMHDDIYQGWLVHTHPRGRGGMFALFTALYSIIPSIRRETTTIWKSQVIKFSPKGIKSNLVLPRSKTCRSLR